jgi:hypothetical protein
MSVRALAINRPETAVQPSILDRYLPEFDVREYHEIEVAAPVDQAYAVLRNLDLNRSLLVRAIFAVREIPARLRGEKPAPLPAVPFIDQALSLGWQVLEEAPGRALIAGAVTRPWAASVKFQGLPAAELAAFQERGFTKIVWGIAARPAGPGQTTLCTETRVLATDPVSRRKFRLYWLVVGTGIKLIRRISLRMARKELLRARSLPC